jgi:pilus assembly protein CpaD
MGSSWTEISREEMMIQTVRTMIAQRRRSAGLAVRAAVVAGCAIVLCACNTDQQVAGAPDTPSDYRQRHPITISEANRTLEIFVGSNRGELNPTQRAQVLEFAQTWRHDATGGVVIDLPVGTSNERAAAESLRMVRSILAASGVPPNGIVERTYHPASPNLATLRISYPKMTAQAGPCGMWPEDISGTGNRGYFENQPYWNFGCANQRNLAAMVDNPADLVQPRAETPAYEMRRTTVIEKYREGTGSATQYSTSTTGKITTVGQ